MKPVFFSRETRMALGMPFWPNTQCPKCYSNNQKHYFQTDFLMRMFKIDTPRSRVFSFIYLRQHFWNWFLQNINLTGCPGIKGFMWQNWGSTAMCLWSTVLTNIWKVALIECLPEPSIISTYIFFISSSLQKNNPLRQILIYPMLHTRKVSFGVVKWVVFHLKVKKGSQVSDPLSFLLHVYNH